jgi:acyl dehydratase
MTPTTIGRLSDLKSLRGTHLGYSDWRTITRDMIDRFADATDDHRWIHVDLERAREGPLGRPVAPGPLMLGLIAPMLEELLDLRAAESVVDYGYNRVRFPAPARAGSRVRLSALLERVEEIPGGVQAVIEATLDHQSGDKPACVAEIIYRCYAARPGRGEAPAVPRLHHLRHHARVPLTDVAVSIAQARDASPKALDISRAGLRLGGLRLEPGVAVDFTLKSRDLHGAGAGRVVHSRHGRTGIAVRRWDDELETAVENLVERALLAESTWRELYDGPPCADGLEPPRAGRPQVPA